MSDKSQPKPTDVLGSDVLAELLAGVAPETPPAGLRAKVLERVAAAMPATVTLRAADNDWKPVAPGLEVRTLFYDPQAHMVSFLLRAQPGASLPSHGHRVHEECLVLEGEFSIGDLVLRAGDFHAAAPGVEHSVASTRSGVLVYLRGSGDDYPFACPT
jgi:anti-sigma factor ChrR (cupin superfamily)